MQVDRASFHEMKGALTLVFRGWATSRNELLTALWQEQSKRSNVEKLLFFNWNLNFPEIYRKISRNIVSSWSKYVPRKTKNAHGARVSRATVWSSDSEAGQSKSVWRPKYLWAGIFVQLN